VSGFSTHRSSQISHLFSTPDSQTLRPQIYIQNIEREGFRAARTKTARFKGELEAVEDVLRNFDEEIEELQQS
jgi:hypothetical protein